MQTSLASIKNQAPYGFYDRVQAGEEVEALLDTFFIGQGWTVSPVDNAAQCRGVDRAFTAGIEHYSVEYKADFKAIETGNLFAELWHVDGEGNSWAGWAISSEAQFLALFVNPYVRWIPMARFKSQLMQWAIYGQKRVVRNQGKRGVPFSTIGLLVPLAQVDRVSSQIFQVQ